MLERVPENPILTPKHVAASGENFEVKGVFNPAAVFFNGQYLLLLRIAEVCRPEKGFVSVPYFEFEEGQAVQKILRVKKGDPNLRLKDTRGVFYKGRDYLSTYSHLRLAKSLDGVHFNVSPKPFLLPVSSVESFGMEDARIAHIEGRYFINYTGVSSDGYLTRLAVTRDFETTTIHSTAFCPLNKDVAFFEEKIGGVYMALHRPHNQGFGRPSIWLAESPDLIHWGRHHCLLRPDSSFWEHYKVGAGAPPIKTKSGWLVIYHGKGEGELYSLNTLLLDLENPKKIIGRGKKPFMTPKTSYEKEGFFNNVIFSNGHILQNEDVMIYYGACDGVTCLCRVPLDALIQHSLT